MERTFVSLAELLKQKQAALLAQAAGTGDGALKYSLWAALPGASAPARKEHRATRLGAYLEVLEQERSFSFGNGQS